MQARRRLRTSPSRTTPSARARSMKSSTAGAARGVGADAKSVARVLGPPGDADWATECVRRTCRVPGDSEAARALGVDFGTAGGPAQQFRDVADKVASAHDALQLLEDAPAELVLLRRCADVCKVTHLLRAAGPQVARAEQQRLVMEAIGCGTTCAAQTTALDGTP